MRKILPLFTLLFFLLAHFKAWASTPEIKTQYVFTPYQTSFSEFLENIIGIPHNLLYEKGHYEKLKEWNPHIENYSLVKAGEEIYLELPFHTQLRPSQQLASTDSGAKPGRSPSQARVTHQARTRSPRISYWFQRLSLKVDYSLLAGVYDQEMFREDISATAQQSSPTSLGLTLSHPLTQNIETRGYLNFTKVNDVNTETFDEDISVPSETSLRLSVHYYRGVDQFSPFLAYSQENLSSFSIADTSLTNTLDAVEHDISLLSFGIETQFLLGSRSYLVNTSYSRSLSSKSNSDIYVNDPFSGSKINFKMSTLLTERFSAHFEVNQHRLSNSEENLNLTRVGFGIGYQVF